MGTGPSKAKWNARCAASPSTMSTMLTDTQRHSHERWWGKVECKVRSFTLDVRGLPAVETTKRPRRTHPPPRPPPRRTRGQPPPNSSRSAPAPSNMGWFLTSVWWIRSPLSRFPTATPEPLQTHFERFALTHVHVHDKKPKKGRVTTRVARL